MVHLSSTHQLGSLHSPHANHLKEILSAIHLHKRRISIKHWHQVLGVIRSMALALPGILSHTQESLRHVNVKRVTLTQGVPAALSDFW